MIAIAILLALILLTLGALLALTLATSRRTHRIMTQIDDLTQATKDVEGTVVALKDQQAKTVASVNSTIARVEAVIAALQGQSNPQLDAVINSLLQANAELAGAVTAEQGEQATLDAERPDPPPPAGPTPIA